MKSIYLAVLGVVSVGIALADSWSPGPGATSGSDTYTGDANDNNGIHGLNGNDTMSGGDGDDELTGGSGGDTIYGDGGDDTCVGEDGPDEIHPGTGVDVVYTDYHPKGSPQADGSRDTVINDADGSIDQIKLGVGDCIEGGDRVDEVAIYDAEGDLVWSGTLAQWQARYGEDCE